MALPPYDFLISAPTDQLGTSLGTDFDYLNAFRSGQGIRNDIDYSGKPMPAVMPPSFTIGDNPDVISDMSLAEYYNFQKYMRERGAADLINPQNKIKPIDDGSDSTGIGEIILPPIASGGGGGGSGIPKFLKTYTREATQNPNIIRMSNFDQMFGPKTFTDNFGNERNVLGEKKFNFEGITGIKPEPKQGFFQEGIGSIRDFFGKFSSPKIKGTLGTRLANKKILPSFISAISQIQSPFNPASKNYNPLLEDQLNIAEANDKVGRDQKSGLLKYNENSVLSGQNAISGFGLNDYQKQLEKYIERVEAVYNKKYNKQNLTDLEKEAATRYKTKYIIPGKRELSTLTGNKTYIENKKQIEAIQKIKDEKAKDEATAAAEQAKLDAAYAAQSQAKKNQIQQSTGGRYDRAPDRATYDKNPTSFSGSSAQGGIQGYGGKSGTPVNQQRRPYGKGGIVTL